MPAQNDTWWQLRAGRDIWRTHGVPLYDTFSHTAYGAFWPNHEWLSQVIFYALYVVGGLPLLTLFAAAVVVAAWAIVWRQTPASALTRSLLVAAVVVAACSTWSHRPQVLSLLLTVATVAILRTRRYAWLPPIFLLWANLHGAVLLGVWLLAAAVPAAIVEGRAAVRPADPSAPRRLAAFAALSLAATLVTPLGLHFWTDIVASLGRIRQLGIAEWAPPRLADLTLLPFWLTLAALVVLAVRRGAVLCSDAEACGSGRVTLVAAALALIPLAVTASRNVPPFLMTAVPAVAALAPRDVFARRTRRVERPRFNAVVAAGAAAAASIALAAAYARGASHLAWTPLPPASLAALDECPGNLYNRYDEGGYLIWFAPGRKVFLDGRQDPYSPALVADQVHAETTGDFAALFERFHVRCAYTPATSILTARLLDNGWTRLYADRDWTVLAK